MPVHDLLQLGQGGAVRGLGRERQDAILCLEPARADRELDLSALGRELDRALVREVLAELLKVAAGPVRADAGNRMSHVRLLVAVRATASGAFATRRAICGRGS